MIFVSLDVKAFVTFSVEHSSRDSGASGIRAQELVAFPSGETEGSSSTEIDQISSDRNNLTNAESFETATSAPPPRHDEIARTYGRDSIQNTGALVESSRTGQSGISIFQRYCLSSHSICYYFF